MATVSPMPRYTAASEPPRGDATESDEERERDDRQHREKAVECEDAGTGGGERAVSPGA